MKKIVILLMVLLSANFAYGQPRHHSNGQRHHGIENRSRSNHRSGSRSEYRIRDNRSHGRHNRPARGVVVNHAVPAIRSQVLCVGDWQTLWNGCHVRLKSNRVHIYLASGDRLLSGDEIILLPNGLYLVRSGSFWHLHDTVGDRVFNVWGDAVELMDNGIFRCYRNGYYYYYDQFGNVRN